MSSFVSDVTLVSINPRVQRTKSIKLLCSFHIFFNLPGHLERNAYNVYVHCTLTTTHFYYATLLSNLL